MLGSSENCVKGNVLLKDDGNKYGWIQANTFQFYPVGEQRQVQVELRSKGEVRDIKIVLDNGFGCVISNVVINETVSLNILWIRVIILFLLVLIFMGIKRWNWLRIIYNEKNIMQIGFLFLVMSLCIWFAIDMYQGFHNEVEPWEYPLTENETINAVEFHTPEIQMFDALVKGMSHVDQYPSTELGELDNPYDISERMSKGTPYWWDATYYKDNYYFYFGQSCILLVVIPYYFITGQLPASQFTLLILSIMSITGIFFMIRQFFRKFKTQTSYILYIFLNCGVVFGSMLYLLLRSGSYYMLTIATAIACMTWCIGLAYAAVCSENKIRRRNLCTRELFCQFWRFGE
jgi:hypothetical protein